jgi:hypothetical protein
MLNHLHSRKLASINAGAMLYMITEYQALLSNQTCSFSFHNYNILGCRWVYKQKLKTDGSLERCKARLVVQGYNQQAGVDLDETFSPVIKPVTIRTILSLTLYHGWAIHRLNVKDIYLSSWSSYSNYLHTVTIWVCSSSSSQLSFSP